VPLIPSSWAGKIIIAILVAAAEVILSESTKKKR
jgi:hypothetical protein